MYLYRPIGYDELRLIVASGFHAFPPRLQHQPIFYPVLDREYAVQIARDWNTKDEFSGFAGWVTEFQIDDEFAAKYPVRLAGGRSLRELWVPAADLVEFNRHIIGLIHITEVFVGAGFKGTLDPSTHLPRDFSSKDDPLRSESARLVPKDIAEFVRNYSDADEHWISFAWNGEHAENFRDANLAFRHEVIRWLRPHLTLASPRLLCDLLRAETEFAKEAWGINRWVHEIAQEMLVRGGTRFVGEFLQSKVRCFDSMLECSCVQISPALAARFVEFCRTMKGASTNDKDRYLWDYGEEFFSRFAG